MVMWGLAVTVCVLSGGPRIQEGNYDSNVDMCLREDQGHVGDLFKVRQVEALVGGCDESNWRELPRLSQDSQPWFPMPPLQEQEALDVSSWFGSWFSSSRHPSPDFVAHDLACLAASDAIRVAAQRVVAMDQQQGIQDIPQATPSQGAALGRAPGEVIDGGYQMDEGLGGNTDGEIFWLTTYNCHPEGYCDLTANNVQVAPGMAACSEHWPFGTHFLVAERWEVVCQDRGSGVVLPNHLDVYFDTAEEAAAWLAQVGDHAEVEVVR